MARLALALPLMLLKTVVVIAADEIHWTITGQSSVTFDWRGPESTLRYGLSGAYDQTVQARTPSPLPFSSAGPFWEAAITGLQPDTTYHYSIGTGVDATFRTPPPRGSAGFLVYAEGDIGDTTSYRNMGPVQQLIPLDPPAFVLMVGDLTYGNAHGQAHVDQHFNDVMVWSRDAAYMPAWGNHEWDSPSTDDLRNYKGRFDLPNPQSSVGEPAPGCCGEDWYWFDYGNVRFIAYPEPYSGAWSDWRTRAKIVMDEAQADPAITFIVTFGHRPALSSGHHPGSTTLMSYMDALGATHSKYVLNLNGHSHNYERSFPQSGVTHITAGAGGASLEQDGTCLYLTCAQPVWSAFRAMHLGVVKLRFTPISIEGGFVCGPTGGGINDVSCSSGSMIDQFTIVSPAASGPDVVAPTVTLAAPTAGSVVSGTVTVGAGASDNVGVAGVQFKLDGVNLGAEDLTSPYSTAWNTLAGTDGSHTLAAVGRDAAGNTATSNSVLVTVDNAHAPDTTRPSVAMTAPAAGSVLSGTVTLSADAADNIGVAGVQFKVDGANRGAEDTTAPYSISWNTSTDSSGPHTVSAAARDAAGNSAISNPVSVTIADSVSPAITITAPASGAAIDKKGATISASASDDTGVVGVQFRVDGQNLGAEDRTAPYSLFWDTKSVSNGTHSITAVARDAAGNTKTATAVTVTRVK